MFIRQLKMPTRSFFLLGPRSTGKSTWLKTIFPDQKRIDLLKNDTYFKFSQNPSLFREIVTAEPKGAWILVDEIQRIPSLLNEVHSLMEEGGYRFALTGSSARKLKRGQANLLAGRASMREFYPLVWPEFKTERLEWEEVLRFGALPQVITERSARLEILDAYAGTYLREEIKEEALTRNAEGFSRFLEVATLANSQVTNLSNISRDSGVARATVSTYFEILVDTLIGRFLPAWVPKLRVKETIHPKFYFFDCGIVRAIQGRLYDSIANEERGHLLETYLFHELLAYRSYQQCGGEFSYWRTSDQVEVDFIWERSKYRVAIEVKASDRWRSEYDQGLETLTTSKIEVSQAYGVYLGQEKLQKKWGLVLPLKEFLELLWKGEIFPPADL